MPHTRTLRRLPLLLGVLALGMLLGLAVSAGSAQRAAQAEAAGAAALHAPGAGRAPLVRAPPGRGYGDKGGHRVRAIQLVNQAEAEVQRGIAWDNTHH